MRKAKETLAVVDPEAAMPLALVGNKADMVHLRQVSTEEGEILAKDFECWFSEVSAAEQVCFSNFCYLNVRSFFIRGHYCKHCFFRSHKLPNLSTNCVERFWQQEEGINNLYWIECLVAKQRVLIHEVKVIQRFRKINIYIYTYI